MFSCDQLVRLLGDYISDELPAKKRDLIDQHLAQCPKCRAFVESYRTITRLARQLPPKPVPLRLMEELRRAAQRLGLDSSRDKPKSSSES